ncbi:MAG TPA: hypothetical protein VGP76_26630 [Planctomycetaceae bacterium]|jgi:hypothetical protein|nr:hypothetical protein [Planctomycetaceae bacterium]
MTKPFSYVVDHDLGFAPNPSGGFCSLAKCKFGSAKRNIVEMAEEGDWIAGTGTEGVRSEASDDAHEAWVAGWNTRNPKLP